MNRILITVMCLLLSGAIVGCSSPVNEGGSTDPNEAITGQELTAPKQDSENNRTEQAAMETTYEIRDGISGFTLRYDDLPKDYQVSTGFSYEAMNHRPPLPVEDQTVLNAIPDPNEN